MGPLSNGFSNSNGGRTQAGPNVWVVPLSFISHTRCFLQFGKQLARHGVIVTFFSTADDAERLGLHDDTLDRWKCEGVDIRLKFCGVQRHELADGQNGAERWVTLIREQEEIFELILKRELELGQSKPTCVISDLWIPGVHETARKYKIPAWVFSSFSAGYTAAGIYLAQLLSKGILKLPYSHLDKEAQEEVISLPGVPLLRLCEIESSTFKSHALYPPASRNGPTLQKFEVVILSRSSSQKDLSNRCIIEGMVYTVGPTFPFASKGPRSIANGVKDDDRHPTLKFLDKQPDSSVLLVAFGNDHNHTPEQMQEIAHGLEDSEQPFLCVFHTPRKTPPYPTGEMLDVISPDCITRTMDRGLFVQGWVRQLEILSHPAVGGFLSHCGQNSCLESVSMGVPLLAWPLYYDQMMNARCMVDDVQIGLAIERGPDALDVVDRKEVERKVRALFQSEEGRRVRENARRMRELALQSVAENGSTYKNMQALVAHIHGLAAEPTSCSSNGY